MSREETGKPQPFRPGSSHCKLRWRADVPRAHDCEAAFCGNPACGLHIVPYTKGGKAICEVVMSADGTLGLIEFCQKHLQQGNANRTIPEPDVRYESAPDNWRPGPEVPCAKWYRSAFCGNPTCGIHIIPYDSDDKPICEVVLSADGTLKTIERCKEHLYDKATRRTEAIPIDEPTAADLPGKAMLEKLRVNADGRPIWTMQVVDTRNMEDLYHRAAHESGAFAVATTMVIRWMSKFNARPEQNPQCMVCKMPTG